ncbi:LOW QUALITY PROTEIN: endo-1,3(4)-beta-glucanase [Aspergillus luchuensis]|uniref:Endo-1,3(4)-beta-glucanase n=1 Tax=Aspergillus kawachii TaxID=1069201 RepID=A0A146EYF6_ASPKA|nr:LOW QUALITY PROTEIN: endo-1,3(4)-beta-glucanase [Aspergillus luchuensis]
MENATPMAHKGSPPVGGSGKHLRDTQAINKDPHLEKHCIIWLQEAFHQPTGCGLLPAMNGHTEWGVVTQTWDESSENWQLALIALWQRTSSRTNKTGTMQVG